MALDSLLLSRDVDVMRVLRPTLEKMAIEVDICQEPRSATDILLSEKFDAVIVDCDDMQGGLEILEGLRNTPCNRTSVTFAVLNGKKTTTQQAFSLGANFVLQKPITALNASRCFHAALNYMLKERRRYFRQTVKMNVRLILGDKELIGSATNISEGGMALLVREALPRAASPILKFTLPETTLNMEIEAEVAWADMKGCLGLRFKSIPQSSQNELEKWLDQRMEEEFPGAMDRIADAKSGAASN